MNDAMRLVRKLEAIAKQESCQDIADQEGEEFFNVDDFAGGNIDDAFSKGYDEGQIDLARECLKMIDPDYEPS